MTDASKFRQDVYVIVNQQVISIEKPVFTIGRQIGNDLTLQDDYVSRRHAEIRYENGGFWLSDLGSTSGTFVNKSQITKTALTSGDLILIANIPFMFFDEREKLDKVALVTTGKLE